MAQLSVCCGARVNQYRVRRGSVEDGTWLSKGAAWLSRVQHGSVGCGVAQFTVQCGFVRVRHGPVQGAAHSVRVQRGSVRVQRGSVRVQRDSVQGAA